MARLLAAATVLALTLLGCNALGQTATPQQSGQGQGGGGRQASLPAVPVAVAAVERGPLRAGPSFSGDIVALQQVSLAPRTPGVIVRLAADVGVDVAGGQIVAELDHSTLDAAVIQARATLEVADARLSQILAGPRGTDVERGQAAVDQAQANLDSARARLDGAKAGGKPPDVETARIGLDTAQTRLDALLKGPRPEQRVILQKDVEKAQNDLYAAQTKRDGDCGPRNPQFTCNASNASVNSAETALNRARLAYELAIAPPIATDLAQAENAVKSAQAALEKAISPSTEQDIEQAESAVAAQEALLRSAMAALEGAMNPSTESDLRVAQANLSSARAQLEAARVNQQQAYVTAPFDGVIGSRLLAEGALASTNAPIFSLVSRDVAIDLPVSQELVGQLAVGQPAQIRSPGLPGQIVPGLIYSVAPAADPRTRTFVVRVVPQDQDGRLRPGMSATVGLDTVSEQEAILVPTDAIVAATGQDGRGVFVVTERDGNTVASFRSPTLGASAGRVTEVLGGLNVGDLVVIQGQSSLRNNQGVRLIGGGQEPQQRGGSQRTG